MVMMPAYPQGADMQFDRYLLAQLVRTTIAVTVTLVGIVWLFQTIRILELVVSRDGPFLDFIIMSITVIPLWLTIAFPISAFIAITWVFQRTIADRELLVMQASGRSTLQLARAPIMLAIGVTAILVLNSTVVLPFSFGIYKEMQFKLRNSIPAVLLREGVFIDVVDGMTMLIGEKTEDGMARDIFLHDERAPDKTITITAKYGKFVNQDGVPAVILQNGVRNEVNQNGDASASLLFETHSVIISSDTQPSQERLTFDMNEDSIRNLLNPETSPAPRYFNQRRAEGHYRIISPLLGFVLVMTAACSVLCGQIRRDTLFRRTVLNIGAAIIIISMMVSTRSLTITMPATTPLLYASLVGPAFILIALIMWPTLKAPMEASQKREQAA
jgi:lipopolysaccharide export system permease protein